ncbi:hypothetical protein [Cohnella thermotolerans]|uniref:hypothetical protein n=1 Tax=Cohnella thermotolerans TaxID=329858 RepID=UPI000407BC26|nr:hypothetical protein [Cohnella thermotolerans]
MPKRNVRSADRLKTNSQRLQEIMVDIDRIRAQRAQNRVAILAGHQRMEELVSSMTETIAKQERNLDKLMKLAGAR